MNKIEVQHWHWKNASDESMNERSPCTPISLVTVFPVSGGGGRHGEWPDLTLVGLGPELSGMLLQQVEGPASCCAPLELPLGPHLAGDEALFSGVFPSSLVSDTLPPCLCTFPMRFLKNWN